MLKHEALTVSTSTEYKHYRHAILLCLCFHRRKYALLSLSCDYHPWLMFHDNIIHPTNELQFAEYDMRRPFHEVPDTQVVILVILSHQPICTDMLI
ncbi:Uncharacterised protein [Serratia fonticola]|uniref:Uncharacterized protein n=1 Tax=Serratia fonticola TaxID=47917 RepID=A0A4U9VE73_SERFO|nr:Uncharacterised protein [Serratia fonticola]